MTGNHPGRSGNPARVANPGLDQLAAQIRNDRKSRNPVIVELEHIETQLLALFGKVGAEHVEPEQAGATMLILGQLFNDLVSKLPEDQQYRAPAIIVNLLRMLGQRLYTGDVQDDELRCPYPLASGKPCSFKPTYTMGGTLTTVMRGHVALHHPGETWPPAEPDEADETVPPRYEMTTAEVDQAMLYGVCHLGHPRTVRTTFTSADGSNEQELYCPTCERIETEQQQLVDHFETQRGEDAGTRECRECHFEVPVIVTADGVVTLSHVVDGTPFECSGSGEPPAFRVVPVPGLPESVRLYDSAVLPALPTPNRPGDEHGEPRQGVCATCQALVSVQTDGRIGFHLSQDNGDVCAGSGEQPVRQGVITDARFDEQQWPMLPAATYRDAGMSDRLEDEQPFDAKPFDGTPLSSLIGTQHYPAVLTRPDGTRAVVGHLEPGFDAEGNVTEISLVRDAHPRPRISPEACPHPKRARFHLAGGLKCLDCDSVLKPDDETDGE